MDMRILRVGRIRMCSAPPPPSPEVSVTVRVVEKVAEQENVDSAELPPLADVINPDALEALFDSFDNSGDTDAQVTFTYVGHTVHVYANRSVELE